MNIKTLYGIAEHGVKATNSLQLQSTGNKGKFESYHSMNVDDSEKLMFPLLILLLTVKCCNSASLVDNDFGVWNKTATLAATAGTALATGANGTVDGAAHQTYLDKIEAYTFNVMGLVSTDSTTLGLYANFCKRMRDEVGAKFQVVLYNQASDYEGVINLKNAV